MKKKLLVFVLMACLAGSVLSACGSKKNETVEPKSKSTQVTEEPTSTPKAEKKPTATPEPTVQESSEEAETIEETTSVESADGDIRSEIKEVIDGYEKWTDKYCEAMDNYDPSDMSSLSTYTELLSESTEMLEKVQALEEKDLTSSETMYLLEVVNRCNEKIAKATENMDL